MDNNGPVTVTLKVCRLVPQVVDNLLAHKLHKNYAMLLNKNGISSPSLDSCMFIDAFHVGTVSPTATQQI